MFRIIQSIERVILLRKYKLASKSIAKVLLRGSVVYVEFIDLNNTNILK